MPTKPLVFPVEQPDTLLPFLLSHVKGRSRNQVKSVLARGQVTVDGRAATQFDRPLAPGQTVAVAPNGAQVPDLPFPILFEDAALLAIDKPVGLLTVASDNEKTRTAYHQVTAYVRGLNPENRVFILHRLDRDTSGVLLFAKNEGMKRALQDDWEALVLTRGYTAVTEGAPPEPQGTMRSFLHETETHLVYSGSAYGGKEAVTRYETVSDNGRNALVNLELDTGRKNQIRVHLKDLGCPVVGDKKYGAQTDPLRRLALHASALVLRRPDTGTTLTLTSPAPKSFRALTAGR